MWPLPFSRSGYACIHLLGFVVVVGGAAIDNESPPVCNATVLTLPVTNVTVNFGREFRGVEVWMGTPPQPLSMVPHMNLNLSYANDGDIIATCWNSPTGRCNVYENDRGSIFFPSNSTGYKNLPTNEPVIDKSGERKDAEYHKGQDVLSLGGHDLGPMPFMLDRRTNPYDKALLGLGPSSYVLEELIEKKVIASRSWAYDQGMEGEPGSDPKLTTEGLLTLGGYDKSRFTGQLYPYVMGDSDCFAKVTIESITFQNSTGSIEVTKDTTSNRGEALLACIDPYFPHITLPGVMFDRFNTWMGNKYKDNERTGTTYYSAAYVDPLPAFNGTMTIKLSGGFTATTPNSELVKPSRDLNDDGTPVIKDFKTSRILLLNALRRINERDLPILGMPFVAATYMIVDHESKQIRFGQPSRTNQKSTKEDLVPILPPGASCAGIAQSPLPSAEAGPESSQPQSSVESDKPSIGIIIGGVVAGVVAGTLLAGVIFFFCRRRKKAAAAERERREAAWSHAVYGKAELDPDTAPSYQPQEIDSESFHEMSTEGVVEVKAAPGWDASYDIAELEAGSPVVQQLAGDDLPVKDEKVKR